MRSTIARCNLVRSAARAALCLALAGACLMPAAADEWNKRTTVTFSAPVEIPGRVLPAGTYTFKLLNSSSDRDIVQIMNQNETKLDATLMAIPDYRVTTPTKTIIRFEERPSNTPEAIKAWFYPGDNNGVQFVYPRSQAQRIAKRTNQNVLVMRDRDAGQPTAVNPSGE